MNDILRKYLLIIILPVCAPLFEYIISSYISFFKPEKETSKQD